MSTGGQILTRRCGEVAYANCVSQSGEPPKWLATGLRTPLLARCALLLLRRQQVADPPQGQRIAGDSETSHDALAHAGRLAGGTPADRDGDVHLRRRELDLRDGRHEGRVAGAERGGIEDRRV